MRMLLLLCLAWVHPVLPAQAEEPAAYELPEIEVEGQAPEARYLDSLPSVTRLQGNALERKKQATVGETLSREAGVSSTYFGPNASRPVIRGLDGDRVRLLENGVGTLDASAASPDHAVSVDPLILDSIEVIRGPSALLYGSNAIGGVVNVRTLRIASQPIDAPELRLAGQLSSVDRGRTLGLLGRTRSARWLLEADVSARGTEDVETPVGQIRNSAARNTQVGLGATYFGRRARYGVSVSALKNRYGTVADPTVQIDLERFRLDLEAESRPENAAGWIETTRIKGAMTAYRHEELEGQAVGTTFRNRGGELRADFKHRKSGAMEGLIGAQAQLFQFSALGDEAFLPTTFNQTYAAYAFEEWAQDPGTVGRTAPGNRAPARRGKPGLSGLDATAISSRRAGRSGLHTRSRARRPLDCI